MDQLTTLSTDDEHIVMMDNTETINLSAGDSMTVNGFMVDVSMNIPNGRPIEFNVNLVTGDHEWNYSFMSMSMAPEINLVSFSGDLQPGSTSSVVITMVNDGDAPINYPVVDVEVGTYLTISNIEFDNAYYWDTIEGNNVEQLRADITVSPMAPMGSNGEISVLINQVKYRISKSIKFRHSYWSSYS